jgi:DNA polymerase III alpha subunit (gram-positive type)
VIVEDEPIDYGARCDRCGLTEFGQDRLRSNGMDRAARPCDRCPPELHAAEEPRSVPQ